MQLHLTKKKLLLIGVGLGILTIVGVGVKLFIFPAPPKSVLTESQKDKALEKILGRSVNVGQSEAIIENLTRETSVADYSYPANAHVLEDSVNPSAEPVSTTSAKKKIKIVADKNVIDNFSFSLPIKHVVITVQINHNPDIQKLEDSSGYRVRSIDPKTYKPFPIKIDSVSGQGFSKEDDTAQKAAFLYYKGNVLSFSVSGYTMEQVDAFFMPLLDSVVLH
jgi:hypothetical protein